MTIKRIEPKDVETAIDLLWGANALWRKDSWIFRGEGNSAWRLVPSAFRDNALLYDGQQLKRGAKKHVRAQIDAEWRTVRLFLAQVDRSGLPFATPDAALFDYQAFKNKYDPLMRDISAGNVHLWPPPDLLPNLGLAQHYAVHTRLIDWTTSPQAAGYFASASGAKLFHNEAKKDGFFTLWALRHSFLQHAETKGSSFARLVRVPRATNPNLHAQDGVFIHYRPYGDDTAPDALFAPEPFDSVVATVWAKLAANDSANELPAYDPPLVRVDVPWRFAGVILRELARMGCGPGRYFPGYNGAAKAVQEQEFWIR